MMNELKITKSGVMLRSSVPTMVIKKYCNNCEIELSGYVIKFD